MKQSNNRSPSVTDITVKNRTIQDYLDKGTPLPLHLLAEVATQSTRSYQALIAKEFEGRKEAFGKKRFSSQQIPDRDLEVKMNNQTADEMAMHYERSRKKAMEARKRRDNAQEVLEQKEEEYILAKRAMESAKAKLNSAEKALDKAKDDEGWYIEEYTDRVEIAEELRKVVLVHRSASLQQLKKYQYRYIVMTEQDEAVAKAIGADELFESAGEFVKNMPYDMQNRELSEEEKSAFEFANMVIQFYLEGTNRYEVIYADSLVAKLLRLNNVEG